MEGDNGRAEDDSAHPSQPVQSSTEQGQPPANQTQHTPVPPVVARPPPAQPTYAALYPTTFTAEDRCRSFLWAVLVCKYYGRRVRDTGILHTREQYLAILGNAAEHVLIRGIDTPPELVPDARVPRVSLETYREASARYALFRFDKALRDLWAPFGAPLLRDFLMSVIQLVLDGDQLEEALRWEQLFDNDRISDEMFALWTSDGEPLMIMDILDRLHERAAGGR